MRYLVFGILTGTALQPLVPKLRVLVQQLAFAGEAKAALGAIASNP